MEATRWADGPVCLKCQAVREVWRSTQQKTGRRILTCKTCRTQFSMIRGTVFKDSHLPLSKWLAATHLMCASKKGMSALQQSRMLGVTYKSAWFMAHR